MIVKLTTERIEEAANDMCRFYCRYPLIWDEQMMGMELPESEICRNCPMSELIKEGNDMSRCRRCGKRIEEGHELCPECARKMHNETSTEITVNMIEANRLEETAELLGTTIANIVEWLVEEHLDDLIREEGGSQ